VVQSPNGPASEAPSTPAHAVVVIGGGSIGERHLRCFLHTGRARVAVCDSSAEIREQLAARYSVPVFADTAAALSGGFTAAVICTPAPLHVPLALQALDRGLHVLIEKPLSHELAGVDELRGMRDRRGLRVAVAYVFHVLPFLAGARDFLGQGELGPVLHATVTSGQPFHRLRPPHTRPYAETYYRDRRTGGGAIQDALTHPANWVESVLGPTTTVFCDASHQSLAGVTVEDTVNVCARNAGTLVSYTLNQFQAPNECTIQFHAAAGSVQIEFHRQRWGVFRAEATEWTWHPAPVPDRDAPFTRQAESFLDEIEGGPAKLCSLEAAEQTLRFNLAALASSDRGVRISCATLAPA
jgi:predicted dehydrogenase